MAYAQNAQLDLRAVAVYWWINARMEPFLQGVVSVCIALPTNMQTARDYLSAKTARPDMLHPYRPQKLVKVHAPSAGRTLHTRIIAIMQTPRMEPAQHARPDFHAGVALYGINANRVPFRRMVLASFVQLINMETAQGSPPAQTVLTGMLHLYRHLKQIQVRAPSAGILAYTNPIAIMQTLSTAYAQHAPLDMHAAMASWGINAHEVLFGRMALVSFVRPISMQIAQGSLPAQTAPPDMPHPY